MMISSYVVQTQPGKARGVALELSRWNGCLSQAADNEDLVILVSESANATLEDTRMAAFERVPGVRTISLSFRGEAKEQKEEVSHV